MSKCGATIEILNGEYVSPCHLAAGHDGTHEGFCLGSRAVWSGGQHTDEWEERWEEARRHPSWIENPHAHHWKNKRGKG
jgi:hypothetical protein